MDDPGNIVLIRLAVVAALLALSAFFSSSETALMTVNQIRIRSLAEAGDKRAAWVMKLGESRPKMLSAILIGNNIVNLSASSLLTVLVTELFGSRFAGAATGLLTLLILLFGEITPKTVATLEAERYALRVGHVIYLLMTVLTPVIVVINFLSGIILKWMHVNPDKKGEMTEEELRTIVEVGHEQGVIESDEKRLINNVFDLGDCVASDIMTPRVDMAMIDINASYADLLALFREERYTRIPVYEETPDKVVGILNVKDILISGVAGFAIRDHLRRPFYTFRTKKVSDLMVEMRKNSNNIVIVVDEYGATAGMITLEDILEEIVGDIQDEYDIDEDEELVRQEDGSYLADGSIKLDDLNEKLGLSLESEDYDSLGGLIIGLLDRLPDEGDEVSCSGVRLRVERVERNRIEKVRLRLTEPSQGESAKKCLQS